MNSHLKTTQVKTVRISTLSCNQIFVDDPLNYLDDGGQVAWWRTHLKTTQVRTVKFQP